MRRLVLPLAVTAALGGAALFFTQHLKVSTPFLNWIIHSFTMSQTSEMPIERVFP